MWFVVLKSACCCQAPEHRSEIFCLYKLLALNFRLVVQLLLIWYCEWNYLQGILLQETRKMGKFVLTASAVQSTVCCHNNTIVSPPAIISCSYACRSLLFSDLCWLPMVAKQTIRRPTSWQSVLNAQLQGQLHIQHKVGMAWISSIGTTALQAAHQSIILLQTWNFLAQATTDHWKVMKRTIELYHGQIYMYAFRLQEWIGCL